MRIVLALDGSKGSSYATQALAQLKVPNELTLVHALELPDLDHPMITSEMRDKVIKEVEDQLRPLGEKLLDSSIASLPPDIHNLQRIHEAGSPSQVILETAKSAQADLIILGARGLGRMKELLLGSVSHRVLIHAPCSTLVVKSPFPDLRRILLPVEGKEDAENVVMFLATHPFRNPVDITVFTVWPQPSWPWPITLGQSKLLEEEALEHGQQIVDEIADQLRQLGYTAAGCVGLGEPTFAIIQQIRFSQSDLIVMSSYGRKGISRFLIGSVSHAVTHQAPCPVLLLRHHEP